VDELILIRLICYSVYFVHRIRRMSDGGPRLSTHLCQYNRRLSLWMQDWLWVEPWRKNVRRSCLVSVLFGGKLRWTSSGDGWRTRITRVPYLNKKAQLTQRERATAVHVWRPTANKC